MAEKDELEVLEGLAEVVEKVETEVAKVGVAASPDVYLITLDDKITDVVKLDAAGKRLAFEDALGRFLEIPDNILEDLSPQTRMAYLVSYRSNAKLRAQREHPEDFRTPGIEVSPRLASATSRISVRGKDPAKDYVWKRTDELQTANYEGWRVSTDPKLQTFGGEVGTSRQIAADGRTEMVLMEAPKGTSFAIQKAAADKSKSRIEGVEKATLEDIKRSGGVPYVPKPGDKNNFT